jgi:hypothetical protein
VFVVGSDKKLKIAAKGPDAVGPTYSKFRGSPLLLKNLRS